MNFGFIIDNRKCIGCHACTVACKAEHEVPLGMNRTWVKYIEKGEFPNTRRLFSVMRCNHCDDAPCVWTKAISTGVFLVPFLALAFGFATVSENMQWLGFGFGLAFLTLTGILLVIDLDKPSRFAYVLLRPQWKSWLVRGGYAIFIYGGLLTLWGIAKFLAWPNVEALALVGSAVFAIITAVYTAFLFAQAKGRDFWQSPILPLHMLVHAGMAGAAIFAMMALFFDGGENWRTYLGTVLYITEHIWIRAPQLIPLS